MALRLSDGLGIAVRRTHENTMRGPTQRQTNAAFPAVATLELLWFALLLAVAPITTAPVAATDPFVEAACTATALTITVWCVATQITVATLRRTKARSRVLTPLLTSHAAKTGPHAQDRCASHDAVAANGAKTKR